MSGRAEQNSGCAVTRDEEVRAMLVAISGWPDCLGTRNSGRIGLGFGHGDGFVLRDGLRMAGGWAAGDWLLCAEGVVDHCLPATGAIGVDDFMANHGNRLEQELAEVREDSGVARREAILSDGFEEIAEDAVDVGGGVKVTGPGSGDKFAELIGVEKPLLHALVEEA